MQRRFLAVMMGMLLFAAPLLAQEKVVTGKVTSEQGTPLPAVTVLIKGSTTGVQTDRDGVYAIRASIGQVLQYRLIGHAPQEKTVGAESRIDLTLRRVATNLDEVVITALGQTAKQRSLGYSQQAVQGPEIAQTTRQNFINSLQGRVAGVEVTSSSGVPGASSQITIRGVSSISSSNQPLIIIDGLPIDNKTLNTGVLASDAPGSNTAFSNRGLDFTNRAADINPEDIETLVVLKGPEASALYGIDAANGAIVITTRRGSAGTGGLEYSNNFRIESVRTQPKIQRTYGPTSTDGSGLLSAFQYFGLPYADTTTFFNNVDGFFQPALTQRHALSFNGGAQDNRVNYRVAVAADDQRGVIPNSVYKRINLTGATQAQVTPWLKSDLSMQYTFASNEQSYKGANGPLIGLLIWPQTDDAKEFATPAGTRRRITTATAGSAETDNPYFNVLRNRISSDNTRLIANLGLVVTPFSWGSLKSNIGLDTYTNDNLVLRHPESVYGFSNKGILDVAGDNTRNINIQTLLNVNSRQLTKDLSISGFVGNQISQFRSATSALRGENFLDPNFVSVNNTASRTSRTTIAERRLLSAFGSATLNYRDYLYVTATGRNDWTSTIPVERNSFFYPSLSTSFIFSDAFPAIGKFMTGRLRAGYAEVGKDARPYAYRPSLEFKTTSYGGYGYGFTGPNLDLRPEFARSYEVGAELGFLQDRLGVDVAVYRKQTKDQIVNDIRGSYGTGYILFNLNGAVTRNEGVEVTLRGSPIQRRDFSWDVLMNFDRARGKVIELPNALPESYVSDTWLYGNVRNGTKPGLSTRSLTGFFYLRNNEGELLIDPTTGLPLRSNLFVDAGYDRQPDFTVGLTNTFRYKKASLSLLVDIRRGGDVFNATEHFLTTRGLSMRTLDRETPRVIPGVLRDGKENTATPTRNTIVVVPAIQTGFYTGMSEELFIEKDINWIRLRDVTFRYELPPALFRSREASLFVTGNDLLLITNYSGLDPIVNGNTAAVGGSGAAGVDYGNFPIPRGVNFGLKVAF
ncbi:MAG: SusC/RagA family TonB-linked outer membrane protein [Gemmatimonadaceae bacterium]|jgi:TonB-linked SusC/RagA family outer membrane protein